MRPIPSKLRERLAAEPRMKACPIRDGLCSRKIDWHHVWMYAGRQINEAWAILGVCDRHHDLVERDQEIKEDLQRISLRLATEEDLAKYPRKDWAQLRSYLQA